MLLAQLLCERPDELRADLMECYGLALDAAAEPGFSPEFAAALAVQLPQDCRWRVSYEKDAWWTGEKLLQAALVNSLNGLIWAMGNKKKRGAPPRPVGPAWARGGGRSLAARPMGRDELLERLSRPREEG